MDRRSFLTSAASGLTALGVSQILLGNCRSVLAAPAVRKWAILIGINDYPKASLKGCLTDVALQENLLRDRFGFQPQDIFKLTNQTATASGLTQLFANELRQVGSEDVVLLHFSGKGGISFKQQPVLMMADGSTIAWEELARLLQNCPTRKILTVLDTSYAPSLHKMQGTRRVRSSQQEEALALQVGPTEALPGVVISISPSISPAESQFALEMDYADFSAGQLTYGLTQALWRSTQVQFKDLLSDLNVMTGDRVVTGHRSEQNAIESLFSQPILPATIGSITAFDTNTNTGEVWLGGVPSHQVVAFGAQAALQSASGQVLQILSRQGLSAKVRLQSVETMIANQALREQIRVIPKGLPLEIAIDSRLPKIERVDAVGAFANLSNIVTKSPGEGSVDYLLTKVPQPNTVVASLPDAPVSDVMPSLQYGLFTPTQEQIATATGLAGEAIKSTIKRISPIVQSLYGAKILGLLENQTSTKTSVGILADLPYWLLLGWNSRQEMQLVLPANDSTVESAARELEGDSPLYLIASDRPFTQTLNHLFVDSTTNSNTINNTATLLPLPQPFGAIQALMQDLAVDEVEGSYRFDVDRYAAIQLTYPLI